MVEQRAELLRGTLDMLILKTLTLEPMHGLGISRRIDQITDGVFQVRPGSLFPSLHRLEQEGWIKGQWGESANRRRAKYYRLTEAGRRRLGEQRQSWAQAAPALSKVLAATWQPWDGAVPETDTWIRGPASVSPLTTVKLVSSTSGAVWHGAWSHCPTRPWTSNAPPPSAHD